MFNFQKKVVLTSDLSKKAQRDSILSSCCTSMGDVPFVDAAIIILYANMLGASETFSMLTTSFSLLVTGFFGIITAWIVSKVSSYQKAILVATLISLLMFSIIICAPFFGKYSVLVLLISLILFSLCHTTYISAWFPMIDTFLTEDTRSNYLGKMRFSWQLSSAILLAIIGFLIGKEPPIWKIQLVMLFSMLVFSWKLYFIAKIPVFINDKKTTSLGFKKGLKIALENKPLTGYSVYLFILNLAAYGTIPLTTLYLKKSLNAPDNIIVYISSITLTGMLVGSFFAGNIIRKFGIKHTFLFVHISYALTNFALFFMGKDLMSSGKLYATIAIILFVYSFTFACANISSSSEMMALVTSGNKVMAMAFCNSFYYAGSGLSRFLSSIIIGSGALAPFWMIGETTFTHYQTLFLVYTICIMFAAFLLVVVPAVFPKGKYIYAIHK